MAKRGAKGDGSIQSVKSGGKTKYRLVVKREGVPMVGPLVEKRGEARKAWRDKWEAPQKPKSTILTACWADLQTSEWWKGLERSTRDQRRRHTSRFVKIYGRRGLKTITAAVIIDWRDGLVGANSTKNTAATAVAISIRKMGHEPGKIPLLPVDETDGVWLTPEQQRRLLGLPMTDRARLIILLGLRVGLRRGEIAGAKHEDFEDGGIHVRRAIGARIKEPEEERGKIDVKKPKNKNSTVWIPLAPELREMIGPPRWGLVVPAMESRKRNALPAPLKPMDPKNVANLLDRTLKDTEFEGLDLHDLRRTFGMSLLEAGVDLRTAAEMMRHDPAMLAKIYARSRRDLKKQGAERLFEAIGTKIDTKMAAA